jgi:hypothetical protein
MRRVRVGKAQGYSRAPVTILPDEQLTQDPMVMPRVHLHDSARASRWTFS